MNRPLLKTLLSIIAIVGIVFPVFAQTKDSFWDEEQISNATVFLYQQISNTSASSGAGTGISGNGRYFILTASHVAKGMKNDAKVIFRLKGDKPSIFELSAIIKDKSLKWREHPVADMAMIELDATNNSIISILKDCAFPTKFINGAKNFLHAMLF